MTELWWDSRDKSCRRVWVRSLNKTEDDFRSHTELCMCVVVGKVGDCLGDTEGTRENRSVRTLEVVATRLVRDFKIVSGSP